MYQDTLMKGVILLYPILKFTLICTKKQLRTWDSFG